MKFATTSEALSIVNSSIQLLQNGVGLTKIRKVQTEEAVRFLQAQLRMKGATIFTEQFISEYIRLFNTYNPDEQPPEVADAIRKALLIYSESMLKKLSNYSGLY